MNLLNRLFGSVDPGPRIPGLTLYHFTTCPYCVRVRRALKRLGVRVAMKNIHRDRAAFDELVAGGGKKQVPCLRIERPGSGGAAVQWLYESGDIVAYLQKVAAEEPAT